MVFGSLIRVPSSDTYLFEVADEFYSTYLQNLQEKITELQKLARENLTAAKVRSKTYYDRRINQVAFSVGDMVYLLKEPRKGKFDDQYTGPHEIIDTLPNGNIKIKIGNHYKIVNANKLKQAASPTIASRSQRNAAAITLSPETRTINLIARVNSAHQYHIAIPIIG